MPLYMTQAAYTAQAWAAMAQHPENREQTFRALVERVGGELRSMYFCLGEYDVVVVFTAPDATVATSIAIAATAAGHLKSIKTTSLVSVDDAMKAMRMAGTMPYQAPMTLSARIEALLDADPRTAQAHIDVISQGGEVTLSGAVASQRERLAAEEIARSAPGVALVLNEVQVGQVRSGDQASPPIQRPPV
jgi:uncharacterized protein with GYD domain